MTFILLHEQTLNDTDRSAAEDTCTNYFKSISVYGLCQDAGIVADNSSFDSCVDDIMVSLFLADNSVAKVYQSSLDV